MKFLLDTNVISELQRSRRNQGLEAWWHSAAAQEVALSVVTVGEIERGISALLPRDPARAQRLRSWFDETVSLFAGRILPLDQSVALEWGRMSADRSRSVADTMIAATAKVNEMTLVTRNVRDLAGLDVRLLNPFS